MWIFFGFLSDTRNSIALCSAGLTLIVTFHPSLASCIYKSTALDSTGYFTVKSFFQKEKTKLTKDSINTMLPQGKNIQKEFNSWFYSQCVYARRGKILYGDLNFKTTFETFNCIPLTTTYWFFGLDLVIKLTRLLRLECACAIPEKTIKSFGHFFFQ